MEKKEWRKNRQRIREIEGKGRGKKRGRRKGRSRERSERMR